MPIERPIHHFGPREAAPDTGYPNGGELSPTIQRYAIPEYREGNLLQDKAVLLTGTGRANGIGAAIAREFGGQGARLVMTATQASMEEGLHLTDELQDVGVEAYWLPADLRDPSEAQRLIAETVGRFGRLDIVAANQGIRRDGAFGTLGDDAYQDVFDINYMATVRLFRPAFEQMRTQSPKGGLMLATTSIANEGSPGQGPYSSMKGAERTLIKTIAKEGVLFKIRANAISPGLVGGTHLVEDLTDKAVGRVLKLANQPEMIEPRDIGRAFLWTATQPELTGQEMQIIYRDQVQVPELNTGTEAQ